MLALLALPGPAFAHGSEDDGHEGAVRAPTATREVDVPQGYTGPGREPYLSYFEGVWLYGQMIATPLPGQVPGDLDVDGDWVVWEDTNRSDLFAYSASASQGFYATNDAARQRHPKVSENVIVYEDYHRLNRPTIYAYFLDTGETRRLSNTSTIVRDPDVDYPLVTWIDENGTNPDVWAYSLLNGTAWNVHPGTDRDNGPAVVGDTIYWRTYRYNIYDIMAYDTTTGETIQVTTDTEIQGAPFTGGDDAYFLTSYDQIGWRLDHYDDELDQVRRTDILLPDARRVSVSNGGLLRITQDVDYSNLVVRNLTNGATNHVSGDLLLATLPVMRGNTIFAPVLTKLGVSLLVLDVSPFAFAKRPTLTIATPTQNTPWVRPLAVSGTLDAGPTFTEPTTFTYRIDGEPPQLIPVARSWRFTLDPNGVEPGTHIVTVRATFREGPPLTTSLSLNIPSPSDTIDVQRAGPAFHAARLAAELNAYVLDNPAAWVLIPLLLILTALITLRVWLWMKPKRERVIAEYVPPDDA